MQANLCPPGANARRSGENWCLWTLSPLNLEKDVEFYEVQLQAGGALRRAPHGAGCSVPVFSASGSKG